MCLCGEKTKLIENYLNELRENISVKDENSDVINYIFCEDCETHTQTTTPENMHENHKLVNLSNYLPQEKLNKTKNDIQLCKESL